MFLGQYITKFSGQGRLVLPKKFRVDLKDGLIVLTRGFEGCILGFSKADWLVESAKQLEGPITEEKVRNLRRYLFSASVEVTLDKQGRFVVPPELLAYARLEVEVMVIGAGDHFEVWDKKSWEDLLVKIEGEYGRIS